MTTRMQIRRDTSSNWTSANPVLAAGEIGYETNTGYMKIGDGSTAWTSLTYGPKGGSTATYTTLTATTVNSTAVNATTLTATAGAGFQNMELLTSGTAASWSLPSALQVAGAKFKVTIIGGGAQGGGTSTTAGQVGGGGGAGGVCIGYYTYVAGQSTMTYSVGSAGSGAGTNSTGNSGTASSTTYNSVTYTANGGTGGSASGAGGAGGSASGGTLNLSGDSGDNGGTMAATSNYQGSGADTPMGFGHGGEMPVAAAGATGNAATNYGAGGSGGRNGTGTTARAGGAGTAGLIIIEY